MCHEPVEALLLEPCEPFEGGDPSCLGALEPGRPSTQGLVGVPEFEEPRHLLLHGIAERKVAVAVQNRIQAFDLPKREAVPIGKQSPSCALEGGVQVGFMLIDTIRSFKCDVEIIVMGLAASMGAVMLMSGTKGKRKALPHAGIRLRDHRQGDGTGQEGAL